MGRANVDRSPGDFTHGADAFRANWCVCHTCRMAYAKAENKRLNLKPNYGGSRPDQDFPGHGIILCVICRRPYRDHEFTEKCYA